MDVVGKDKCNLEKNLLNERGKTMSAQRMLFLTVAALLVVGIWMTGWDKAHWLFYAVVGLLSFAFISGVCPTLIMFKKLGFK